MRDNRLDKRTCSSPGSQVPRTWGTPPSRVMFWVLVLPASAVFAPCVIVPVWEDYKAMALAERLEAESVARMHGDVRRLERHLEGLRNDPAVIARLAQRDLGYTRPYETSVLVDVGPVLSGMGEGDPGRSTNAQMPHPSRSEGWGTDLSDPPHGVVTTSSPTLFYQKDGAPWPPIVGRVLGCLPFADRVDVFTDPTARTTLLCLSGGLMVSAFALYPPRRRGRTAR